MDRRAPYRTLYLGTDYVCCDRPIFSFLTLIRSQDLEEKQKENESRREGRKKADE